jgi:hypothetical protein
MVKFVLYCSFACITIILATTALAVTLSKQGVQHPQRENLVTLIAFSTYRTSSSFQGDLVILNPVTHEEKVYSLENGSIEATRLFWSPDYRKIMINYVPTSGTAQTAMEFDLVNGTLNELTSNFNNPTEVGGYSHSGGMVYYTEGPIPNSGDYDFYILDRNKSTSWGQMINGDQNILLDGFWSPIEGQLAANGYDLTRERSGNLVLDDVFLIDARRRVVLNLTKARGEEIFSSWSPDGLRFAYISAETGKREVYIRDISGRNKQQISQLQDSVYLRYARRTHWTNDGNSLLYLKKDSPDETDTSPVQLVIHNLITGQQQVLIEKERIDNFDLSPISDEIAYTSFSIEAHSSQLCILNMTTKK